MDLSTVLPVDRSSSRFPFSVKAYRPLLPTGCPGRQGARHRSTTVPVRCCFKLTWRATKVRPVLDASALLTPLPEDLLRPAAGGVLQLMDQD